MKSNNIKRAFFGTLKRSKKDASAKVAERAEEVATQEVATTEEIEKVANAVKEEADAVVPEVVVTNSEGKTEEPVEVAVSEPTEVTEVKESETPEEPTELTPIEETVKEEEAVVAEKPAAAKKP